MRWAWPFKARSGNGRNDRENCSSTGDAPPDFLCVGAQKGATSWLYYQLASHPDFWMPPIKELHYFDQLSRIQRQATPRPRDRRDLCFLEGIGSLSGQRKRHVHPDLFRIYFFDDLERNPTELRRTILHFLEADANKRSGRLPANYNADAAKKKLRLTDKVRACMAKFFEQELKACAAQLGGPAMKWPARYGFSVFCFVWQLADYFDLFPWCDWVA